MEDAEQRHLSMTLIYIVLFCRRESGHRNLKHLQNVFFFDKICVYAKFIKKRTTL